MDMKRADSLWRTYRYLRNHIKIITACTHNIPWPESSAEVNRFSTLDVWHLRLYNILWTQVHCSTNVTVTVFWAGERGKYDTTQRIISQFHARAWEDWWFGVGIAHTLGCIADTCIHLTNLCILLSLGLFERKGIICREIQFFVIL